MKKPWKPLIDVRKKTGFNQTKNVLLRACVIGNHCDFTHVFRVDDEWNFTWMFNLLFIQLGWLHRYLQCVTANFI